MRVLRPERAIVLMYHRVVDNGRDPFWLHVAPDQFDEHLEVLTGSCDVVPLERIREPFRGRRRVAITFDDGPNVEKTPLVLDKLEKYGVVATFMLVGQNINDGT